MARSMSLHVGLNSVDPAHYDGWDGQLTACEFDANDMRAIAEALGYDESTTLLTADGTAVRFKIATTRARPTGRTRRGWRTTGRSSTTSSMSCGASSPRASASSCC